MAQKLSVQIALEGGKEVERQLAAIGQEGQKAFQKIDQAAQQAGGFKNLKMGDVTAQLKEMGITGADSINQIKQAARTAGKFEGLTAGAQSMERGLVKVAEGSRAAGAGLATVVEGSRRATAAFGLTRRELGGLRAALRQVDFGPLGNQLMTFGRVGSAFGPVGISIAALGATVAGTVAAFAKFANIAKETAQSVGQLAKAGQTSFEFMSSLQTVFAQGGTSLKTFSDEMSKLQQILVKGKKAQEAFAESSDRVEEATLNVKEAQEALTKAREFGTPLEQMRAELRLREALRAESKAEANDLETLARKFERISNGVKQTFDPLTTMESKVAAIGAVLGKLAPENQLAKLADIFKNLASDAERAKLGQALGLSPETIETLSRGGAAIRKMQAEVIRLGIALDDLDKKNLSGLRSAQFTVGGLFDALKNKMGALASPAFLSFWEGLGERIKELIPNFLELARAFGRIDFRSVGEAVADFILQLAKLAVEFAKAIEAASKGDWSSFEQALRQAGDMIIEAGTEIGSKIGKAIVAGLFSGLKDALAESLTGQDPFGMAALSQKLIESIKKFRFTDFFKDLFSVGKAGAAEAGGGQLGGVDFGPMIAGAEVAAARIKQIFADAFSPPATLDFSGIINAAQTAANDLQLLFTTAFQNIGANIEAVDFSNVMAGAQTAATDLQQLFFTALGNILTIAQTTAEEIGSVFSGINIADALSMQIDALIRQFDNLAGAAAAAAAKMDTVSGGAGGDGGGGLPFARGGWVGGRGTGTSDSNLAWLSRGEYVVPARAVRQPAVLAFLDALRRSGGNLRGILDDMGHFARGGMIMPSAIPAFAGGGRNGGASASRVLNLTIGTETFRNLSVPESTAVALERFAVHSQIASTGRKPSWRR